MAESRKIALQQGFYELGLLLVGLANGFFMASNLVPTLAKFIGPDWGDKVDSGIGLYRHARLHRLAGRYDNHMPESTTVNVYPPVRDYEFGYNCWTI
jgi:hypothetical protein